MKQRLGFAGPLRSHPSFLSPNARDSRVRAVVHLPAGDCEREGEGTAAARRRAAIERLAGPSAARALCPEHVEPARPRPGVDDAVRPRRGGLRASEPFPSSRRPRTDSRSPRWSRRSRCTRPRADGRRRGPDQQPDFRPPAPLSVPPAECVQRAVAASHVHRVPAHRDRLVQNPILRLRHALRPQGP